jgi:hypothetical protein
MPSSLVKAGCAPRFGVICLTILAGVFATVIVRRRSRES